MSPHTTTDTRHAGDLSARDAYTLLLEQPDAVLVDVRTGEEHAAIGLPDLTEAPADLVRIPWTDRAGNPNPHFLESLAAAVGDPGRPLLILCRSGARSEAAARAAAGAGYRLAINVADGFEGPPGPDGRRGTVAGWQAAGLPWRRES